MFNKLKKALEGFVEDTVTNYVDSVVDEHQQTTSPRPITPQAKQEKKIEIELPSFQRVSKAPAVYTPIYTFSSDDIPQLMEALDDPDPEQQVHAIQMAYLVAQQFPSKIFTISEILVLVMQTDPDAPARAAAAEALRMVKTPKSRGDYDVLGDKAISQRYKEVLAALIQTMEEDEDLLTRQNAAESLALTGTDSVMRQGFINLRRKQGDDIDPFIRMVSSMHLGGSFTQNMSDTDRAKWRDALLQAYVDYPEMRGVTRVSINDVKIDDAVPYILKDYYDATDNAERSALLGSLGQLGTESALDALVKFLYDDDITISSYAINGLNNMKHERVIQPLKKFRGTLPPDDSRLRSIEKALVDAGDRRDIKENIKDLDDPEAYRQSNALTALGNDGSPEALAAVIDFLSKTQIEARAYEAFRILIQNPSEEAARVMIDRVCDGTIGYRQVSINLVSKMKMPHAIAWLDKAVDERATPEAMVKIQADRKQLKRL